MSFAELGAATNFSFLHGASHPSDMLATAIELGHTGIGIADINTVAGVVRAYAALRDANERAADEGLPPLNFKLVVGAQLVFADGTPDVIAYPTTRAGWGRLTRLLTTGNLRTTKGGCILHFADLIEWADEMALIVLMRRPTEGWGDERGRLRQLKHRVGETIWLGATMHRAGRDRRSLAQLQAAARATGIPLIALNAPLYATPDDRPLHDIVTCIREHCTIADAGRRLAANAERHLKSPHEMARLFASVPQAIAETQTLMGSIDFSLGQLGYEYPHEPVPPGYTPQAWLEELVRTEAAKRWPDGVPDKMQALLVEEFDIIARQNYAAYFLTVHDIVAFAQRQGILCQGRGSAANSAVCFVLGITAVDPAKHNLLFSRFISEERREPPDIDVDFEHERREEVMQYIYQRYGRERAGIVATVIHYRPRSAVREVGKALGLSEDVTTRLSTTVWGSFSHKMDEKRFAESGFDLANPEIARLNALLQRLLMFPRHLSQHVGGFVLTEDRLDETVPIHNAAMADRTFIEWDKDDIDTLGLMKVDVLALGMLTCLAKAFVMLETHIGKQYTLDNVPGDDVATFEMLQRADSLGVFQVESRAQMNMLPRLKPTEFYDLAIQVAIVRPGPIQGEMVHPYLRRKQGREVAEFPSPHPDHGPADELFQVLGKTLGVPLFQEQAMKLCIVAAKFTPGEANQLRRAMATFRHVGGMDRFEEKMVGGMVARGYQHDFAHRCYKQIQGFGSYGFPESHAVAFARLVWVSSYVKCHYPAVFCAALLNAQPMGFYAPAQIVRDAIEHGVEVLAIDANASGWDNSLEGLKVRLGLRQIDGFKQVWAAAIVANRPYASIEELARRAKLPAHALRLLADADACRSLGLDRREALWDVRRTPTGVLPLFAAADARELGVEPDVALPAMRLGEHVAADYQTTRLSLKDHPLTFVRSSLAAERVLSCAEYGRAKNGVRVKVAGVVLVRQRPGKGNAIFVTLEDETGVANIVIWARLFEASRMTVMAARVLLVEGEVQRSPEGVMHLMASRLEDRTALLSALSDTHAAKPQLSRADVFVNPQHTRHENYPHPDRSGHPRDVRIIPKSRDFH